MSQFSDTVPVVTKCNTCKAAFPSIDLIRDHYRSDWHVLNSKRRASGLAHVTLEEYRRQNPSKKRQPKPANTSPTKGAPVSAPPPPRMEVTNPDTPTTSTQTASVTDSAGSRSTAHVPELVESFTKLATDLGIESERLESVVALAVANEGQATNSDDEEDHVNDTEDEEPIVVEPVS